MCGCGCRLWTPSLVYAVKLGWYVVAGVMRIEGRKPVFPGRCPACTVPASPSS